MKMFKLNAHGIIIVLWCYNSSDVLNLIQRELFKTKTRVMIYERIFVLRITTIYNIKSRRIQPACGLIYYFNIRPTNSSPYITTIGNLSYLADGVVERNYNSRSTAFSL